MKNTILAIALTAAAVPFTFAAQANPPAGAQAQSATSNSTSTAKTGSKKNHKKSVKKAPAKSDSTGAPAAGSASSAVKK